MRILIVLLSLSAVMLSAGCQPDPRNAGAPLELEVTPAVTQMTEIPPRVTDPPDTIEIPMSQTPERVPPAESTTPVTGEVPQGLLDAIYKDLAGRTGTVPDEISVIQAQSIVWNDGSLGCPQPGMAYTQATVPGYWVVLEVDGKQYDYRVTSRGYFFLCEGGVPPVSPGGTPNS